MNRIYQRHPSEELNRLFQQKPYQGQNPELAQLIFLGLDANFSEDIENNNEKFDQIKEYLKDGVAYWEKNKIHHPFLLSQKYFEDGVPYHKRFAKLNLDERYAKLTSFAELLDIPTVGNTGSNKKEFYNLLDINYLKKLENTILNSRKKKLVFISRSVWDAFIYIKKKFGLFKWLPDQKIKGINEAHKIYENSAVSFYQITHFSAAISDNHLKEIRDLIDDFLKSVRNVDRRIQLELFMALSCKQSLLIS